MTRTRLAVAESGMAAKSAPPARYGLSRYPTSTAPAVPGHVHTHLRPSPAVTSPPGELQPRTGVGHVSGHSPGHALDAPQAQSQGAAATEIVGRRRRWPR
jgi:hypothetical protein